MTRRCLLCTAVTSKAAVESVAAAAPPAVPLTMPQSIEQLPHMSGVTASPEMGAGAMSESSQSHYGSPDLSPTREDPPDIDSYVLDDTPREVFLVRNNS